MKNFIEIIRRTKYWILIMFIINVVLSYNTYGHFFWDLFTSVKLTLISLLIPFLIGLIIFFRTKNINKTVLYINILIFFISFLYMFSIYGRYFVGPKYS